MKLDDLIIKLIAIRNEHGNLPVVVHDGADYCPDLDEVSRVETDEWSFFTVPKPGNLVGDRVTVKAVRLK